MLGPAQEIVAAGGRREIGQWIGETVQGRDWKRGVTITELDKAGQPVKTMNYVDCFPTSYVFPAFSATGTGNLHEELTFSANRLEFR